MFSTPAFSTSPVVIRNMETTSGITTTETNIDESSDISALEINTKTGSKLTDIVETATDSSLDETPTINEEEEDATTTSDFLASAPETLAAGATNIVNRIGLLGNTLGQNILQSIVQKQPTPPEVQKVR